MLLNDRSSSSSFVFETPAKNCGATCGSLLLLKFRYFKLSRVAKLRSAIPPMSFSDKFNVSSRGSLWKEFPWTCKGFWADVPNFDWIHRDSRLSASFDGCKAASDFRDYWSARWLIRCDWVTKFQAFSNREMCSAPASWYCWMKR